MQAVRLARDQAPPAAALPQAWLRALGRLAIPLIAAWLALGAGLAMAADAVVIALTGSVVAEREAAAGGAPSSRALRTGDELSQGDLIRTGADGRAQVRFSDGGLVSLQPRTDFRIDEYQFDSARQRSFFSLLRGALRSATGAIGKREREDYRLRTPTATIGIRGTEFLAEETVCDPACSPGARAGLRVSVTEGRIAVTTRAGTLEVGAGEAAEVESPDAMPRLAASGPILGPVALPAPAAPGTATRSSSATATSATGADTTGTSTTVAATTGATSRGTSAGSAAALETKSAPGPTADGAPPGGDPAPIADRPWPGELSAGGASGQAAEDATSSTDLAEILLASGLTEPFIPVGDSIGYNVRRDEDGDLLALDGLLPELPEEKRMFYSVLMPRIPGAPSLQFDSRETVAQYDASGALESLGTCPSFCLARGTASAVETGFEQDVVAWGRWTGGAATVTIGGSATREIELDVDQGIHYLIGTPSRTVPTQGTFSYALLGATSPTLTGGGLAPGQFSGTAAVWFGPAEPARIGLDASVSIGGATIGFATTGGSADPAASQLRTGADFGFSGTLGASVSGGDPAGCANSGCTVELRGGLFGEEAARLGFTYSVGGSNDSRKIGGAAVFGQIRQ